MSESIGPDKQERDKRIETALHAKLDTIAKHHEERVLGEVAEMIARHEQVDNSSVPDVRDAEGNPRAIARVAWHRDYARFDEDERQVRNPDVDHWSREWIVAQVNRDHARSLLAEARLEEFSRADTLIGAASSVGGFADGSGGTLLPRPLESIVEIARDKVAKMARYATTYTMTAKEHNIPTAAAMTAYMQAEGTSPTTTGLTFAQVPLIAHAAVAKAVASKELLADAAINVVNIFARRGGAALAVLEDQQFFRDGNGTAPNVTKIDGAAYAEITTAELKYTDMLTMYTNVEQQYRDNARWFVSSNVLRFLSLVRDGNGRPMYQGLMERPAPVTDDPTAVGTILGKPVNEVVFSDGEIWFGDPSAAYAIGRRQGIQVDVSDQFLFDTRKVMWLLTARIAGENVDATAAAQYAKGITSATSL